jgi:hypothetical protein
LRGTAFVGCIRLSIQLWPVPVFDFDPRQPYLGWKLFSTGVHRIFPSRTEINAVTCPKCGHEQPDVFSQCQQCRHIFPSTPRQAVPIDNSASPSSISSSSGPSIPAFISALIGALVLGVALWWLWTPEGLPLPEGSYVNEKHQFAIASPPGWVALSRDNYKEILEKIGNRLPKSLQDGLSNRRIEVGFVKLLEEPDFSPNINVVVMQTEVPELDEKQLAEGAEVLSAEFKKVLDSYKLEKSELISVDELTSAQFSSSGTLKVRVADAKGPVNELPPGAPAYMDETPSHFVAFDLKLSQTLVPGKKRGYIITCTSDAKQSLEYKRAFDEAIDSFRVLERPSRFGPILMGGIQGGLLAALAYLLYFIVTSLAGFIRR